MQLLHLMSKNTKTPESTDSGPILPCVSFAYCSQTITYHQKFNFKNRKVMQNDKNSYKLKSANLATQNIVDVMIKRLKNYKITLKYATHETKQCAFSKHVVKIIMQSNEKKLY